MIGGGLEESGGAFGIIRGGCLDPHGLYFGTTNVVRRTLPAAWLQKGQRGFYQLCRKGFALDRGK